MTCDVPFLCCAAAAHCKGGIWQINSLGPCAPDACAQIPCGAGLGCAPGAVCIEHDGPQPTIECRPNPCAGALDCACAGSYCAEQGMGCAGVKGDTVICQ